MLHPVYADYRERLPGVIGLRQIAALDKMLKEMAKTLTQTGGFYPIEYFAKGSVLGNGS